MKESWLALVIQGALAIGAVAAPAEELPPPKEAHPQPEELPLPRKNLSNNPQLDGPVKPIDLAVALRLAGVQNPEILLARERVAAAMAQHQLAAAQYLPDINLGTNYDLHRGNLQQANGTILKVNRDSLYFGMGANAVGGGTVNFPGIAWNQNLSDLIFDELVGRQVVRQRQYDSQAVRNDVLLRVANGYLDLLRAEGRRAVTLQTRDEAQEVARITANYARVGQGRQADADRAATELEQRTTDVIEAENQVLTASARLCQLLGLDPSIRLHAIDGWVVPAPLVPDPIPLPELIAISLVQRPELSARRAAIEAALLQLAQAKVLPFSPTVMLGFSVGEFGGGSNLAARGVRLPDGTFVRQPRFDRFDERQDFDAILFWTARNLGVGNLAQVRLMESNLRSSNLRELEMLDRVRAEVATADARVHARYAQIETGERAVESGRRAFTEDLIRTRNPEWLPIEVLDSLRLLGRSRLAYLEAIIAYNRAQFELYVALGQPPADKLARPIPATLVPGPDTLPAPITLPPPGPPKK